MKKYRGLIALVLSVLLGLIAARAVYCYLNRPGPVKKFEKMVTEKPRKTLTFSDKIPKGMRVVTVKLDRDSNVPNGINRGDLVDVAATSAIPKKNGASVTRIILERVTIYDMGEKPETKNTKASKDNGKIISLLLNPEQAIGLIATSKSARIDLIARNNTDKISSGKLATAYTLEKGIEKIRSMSESHPPQPAPGMRAMTLTVKDTDGILGMLKPGDHVDIIVTCPWGNISVKGLSEPGAQAKVTKSQRSSRILLQNMEILITEKTFDLALGKEKPVRRITLLVTPKQAEELTVIIDSDKKSIVRFVTRHPDDKEQIVTNGVNLLDVLTEQKEFLNVNIYKGGGKGSSRTFYHSGNK